MKIAVVCLKGLEAFVKPVAKQLSEKHDVTEVYSSDFNEIKLAVEAAEMVWIEWANELAIQLTNSDLLDGKKVILRCHSYELFSGFLSQIRWSKVSSVIFVGEHIRDMAKASVKELGSISYVIPNGLDVKEFEFMGDKASGRNLAFVANMNAKKGPMLLMQAISSLVKKYPEYKLHIAGAIQDPRFGIYIDHFIAENGLSDNVTYYGYVEDVKAWLKDKDFIVCTSPIESQGMGICEAMAMGIKPLIHNFIGAEKVYSKKYLWNTVDDFVEMVVEGEYNANEYRNFVAGKFSLEKTMKKIERLVDRATVPKHMKDGVTAIIAVKNGEASIGRAIESLQAQTVKPKIVVVDDASTDKTAEIASGYGVEVIKLKENLWVASARNVAARKVDTKYIMFLDADDALSEDYIEETVFTLEQNPDKGFAYTDMFQVKDGDDLFTIMPEFDMQGYVHKNYVPYSAMMRTEDFLPGYNDYLNDCRNHMYDHELFLRIAITKPGIKSKGGAFYYTIDPNSISKNYERGRSDMYLQMMSGFRGINVGVNDNKKRILLVCWGRDYIDSSKMSFELYTFRKPLEEFGEVFTFFWDIETKYFGQEGMIERLKAKVEQLNPDFIFHVCYKNQIPVDTWKELSEKHTTIGFFCDDNWRYEDYSKEYSKGFTHIVTTYEEAYDKYVKLCEQGD